MGRADEMLANKFGLLFVALASSACSPSKESRPARESLATAIAAIEIDSNTACIDLTAKGLDEINVNGGLIDAAIADAKAENITLVFYKALSLPNEDYKYYVFRFPRFFDVYRVYLVDEKNQRFSSKFTFNGLSYAPNIKTCIYPGLDQP